MTHLWLADPRQRWKFTAGWTRRGSCLRFFGIVIRMYAEAGGVHHRPHIHAYYQKFAAVYAVDSIETLGGQMPQRQQRLVVAWAEIHQEELLENWERLQQGQPPVRVEPLR